MNDTERFNTRKSVEDEIIPTPQKQKVAIPSKTIQKKNQDHFKHLENLGSGAF
jgi:hypothetical protein